MCNLSSCASALQLGKQIGLTENPRKNANSTGLLRTFNYLSNSCLSSASTVEQIGCCHRSRNGRTSIQVGMLQYIHSMMLLLIINQFQIWNN